MGKRNKRTRDKKGVLQISEAERLLISSYRNATNSRRESVRILLEFNEERDRVRAHSGKTAEYMKEITVDKAFEQYILSRENIASPSTIVGYLKIKRLYIDAIKDKRIGDVTRDDIQEIIGSLSCKLSPKTIRNIYGLLSAVFKAYRPNFSLDASLPKNRKANLYIPTSADVHRLLDAVRGTVMELPVLLAVFGPMRRGEISALTSDNISGRTVHVLFSMVRDRNNKWITKSPKTEAGDRYIEYPDFVAGKWKGITGEIVGLNPDQISARFKYLRKKIDLPPFRFHDLRHFSASYLHAKGVPDSYIMARGGWESDDVLKEVYRHVLTDEAKVINEKINGDFRELING